MADQNGSKFLPAIFLVVFLVSEAFLKSHVADSALKTAAIFIAIASFLFLIFHFSKKSSVWHSLFEEENNRRYLILFFATIAFGAIFRFWRLGTLADGMAWDEAYKGLDALAIREYGERPIFLNWNAGREALIAYLVAASQHLFDYSVISVRAVLAFFGVLTLIVFYLFSKRVFNMPVAFIATFLLAVSKWHIIHTRYAVRVGLIVFFEVAVLYFLARGLQSQKKNSFSFWLAGIAGGLGLYTYIAYRIFPVVALAFLLDRTNLSKLKENWKALAGGAVAALLVSAPLLHFYWENRISFTDRMQRTAVWNTRGSELSPTELVVESTVKTMGLFTWRGDAIDRHNLHEEPMLSSFSSGLFFLGLGITIINFKKRYAVFLLIYFFLTILPGILSVNAPHSSRTLGVVIPAFLFVTIGFLSALQIFSSIAKQVSILFAAIILGGNFYSGPNDGLLRYSQALDNLDPKTSALWGVDRDQYRAAQLLNSLGTKIDPYLSPQFYFHSTVEYLTHDKSEHKLFAPGMGFQESFKQGKTPVVILQEAECNLWWLRDDDKKQFFKWWGQSGPYDVKRIRAIINRSYVSYSRTTNMTDWRMVESISRMFPGSKKLRMDSFTVFVIQEQRKGAQQIQPHELSSADTR